MFGHEPFSAAPFAGQTNTQPTLPVPNDSAAAPSEVNEAR